MAYDNFNSQNYSLSRQYFNELIKIDSTNSDYYSRRGYCNRQLGLFQRAETDYTRAIDLDKDQYFYYNNRAELYVHMGEFVLAKNDLTESIKLNPSKNPKTYFNRGFVNLKLEDTQAACQDFKVAKQLGHKDAEKMIIENCKK